MAPYYDRQARVTNVTHITQQINLADTDKAVNSATINGSASHAGQIATLSLIIRKPNGDTITEALTPSTLRQAQGTASSGSTGATNAPSTHLT